MQQVKQLSVNKLSMLISRLSALTTTQKIKVVAYSICFILLAWFIGSYIDIIAHNQTTHSYSNLNLFTLLSRL